MEILIDTSKETVDGIRNAIRMLQSLVGPESNARRGAGAVEEATAGLSEAVERLKDAPPPPPPPPPPPSVAPGAATITSNATADASSAGTTALVDSAGVKWDSKLHTSTKTKDIDGKWKARKPREAPVPLAPATVTGGTTPPPPPPPPIPPTALSQVADAPTPPPPTVLVPSSDDDADIEVETDTGELNGVPQGSAPVGMSFADFIARLTSGMNDGSVTQVRVAEVQKQLGIVSLFSLGDTEAAKLPDAIKAFEFTS